MNKKQFNRVKSLYRDKVSSEICVSTIISMSNTTTEASIFIEKFYQETQIQKLKDVVGSWKDEAMSWESQAKDWKRSALERDKQNEPFNGAKLTNVEDQRSD